MKLNVWADGSATIKSEPGGYGWLLAIDGIKHSEGSGHLEFATNNDAELSAAVHGLAAALKYIISSTHEVHEKIEVTLISDSQIILNWANGTYRFKQKAKQEQYEILKSLMKRTKAKTQWCKGHSGIEFNERCDKLAKKARKDYVKSLTASLVVETLEKPIPVKEKSHKKPRHPTGKKFRWRKDPGGGWWSDYTLLKKIAEGEPIEANRTLDAITRVMVELMEIEENRK